MNCLWLFLETDESYDDLSEFKTSVSFDIISVLVTEFLNLLIPEIINNELFAKKNYNNLKFDMVTELSVLVINLMGTPEDLNSINLLKKSLA